MPRHTFFGVAFYVLLGVLTVLSLIEIEFKIPEVEISFLDKMLHAGAYAVLMMTGGIYYLSGKDPQTLNRHLRILGVLLIGFGILIEVLQKVLPVNRWFEIWDVAANIAGVFLGAVFLKAFAGRVLR